MSITPINENAVVGSEATFKARTETAFMEILEVLDEAQLPLAFELGLLELVKRDRQECA